MDAREKRQAGPRTRKQGLGAEAISGNDIDRLYGLEPIIEIGAVSSREGLEQFSDVACPYCGECILLRVDLSAGSQAYVEDCQVCCQPMTVNVAVGEDDGPGAVTVERI